LKINLYYQCRDNVVSIRKMKIVTKNYIKNFANIKKKKKQEKENLMVSKSQEKESQESQEKEDQSREEKEGQRGKIFKSFDCI
jgi:hypothetical protein